MERLRELDMRSVESMWRSLVYDHGDGSQKGRSCAIRVLAAERTDGPSQRRRVASTRSVASGRPGCLTRPVPASRQQVSQHYAGLSHNAQMAGTHYCYGAYLQQNLRDSSI